MTVLRSKKYSQLEDEQIIKLLVNEPVGESLYFLRIEVTERNLEAKAQAAIEDNRKKNRHSTLYYLFYLLLFGFFLARFGGDFI
jgi:hypothetical protein